MGEDAQDRGADVQISGHCAPLRVQPLALRSCLSNLLENALRYAGSAQIELRDSRDQVEVRVCDHGPGIAAEQREAVLEALFRIEGSRNRNSGGVSLAPPQPPPPAQISSADSEELFSAIDSDGSISKDELSSLFEALTSSDTRSTNASASNDSGYADRVASLLKQYNESASYTSKIGSQLSLTA